MIALTIIAGTFLSGLAVMVFELCNAPEGCEDERGFHAVPRSVKAKKSAPDRGYVGGMAAHAGNR